MGVLVSSLIDIDLARRAAPTPSAMGRVAQLALVVQPNVCHGNSFRKESDDTSSSEGGFMELPGFSAQTPYIARHVSVSSSPLIGEAHSGSCGQRTQSLGG